MNDPIHPDTSPEGGSPAASCSLSSLIGFKATKGFRSTRRAMRPQVGDSFTSQRDGELIHCVVDFVGSKWVGRRIFDESGTIEFVKTSVPDWPAAIISALRIGAEFSPANARVEARPDQSPTN